MMMTADALRALSPDEMIYRLLSLHHEVEQLKRMVYGSRSERFVPDQSPTGQLSLLPLPEPAPAALECIPLTAHMWSVDFSCLFAMECTLVLPLTLVPELYSKGAMPQKLASFLALSNRVNPCV